jgi:tetratricopeptide (TPR) repeat protein
MEALPRTFEQALEACWCSVGRAAKEMGEYEQAEYSFRNGLRCNEFSYPCLYEIALVLQATGRWEEASEYWRRAALLHRGDPVAWSNMGLCFLRTGNFDDSHEAYQRAISSRDGAEVISISYTSKKCEPCFIGGESCATHTHCRSVVSLMSPIES